MPAEGMMAGVIPGAGEDRTTKKLLPVDAVGPLREDSAELERIPVRETDDGTHTRSRQPVTRRDALCRMGNGFGMLAFASLVGESIVRAAGAVRAGRRRSIRASSIIRRAPSASSSCS